MPVVPGLVLPILPGKGVAVGWGVTTARALISQFSSIPMLIQPKNSLVLSTRAQLPLSLRPQTVTISPTLTFPMIGEVVSGPKRTFAFWFIVHTGGGSGVNVGVRVGVSVGNGVGVSVGVFVGVFVGVSVGVGVLVGGCKNGMALHPAAVSEAAVMEATCKKLRRENLVWLDSLLTAKI
jgi:hypothetical protein